MGSNVSWSLLQKCAPGKVFVAAFVAIFVVWNDFSTKDATKIENRDFATALADLRTRASDEASALFVELALPRRKRSVLHR